MNIIDISVFVLLAIFIISNTIKGFVRGLAFLLGIIAGFWLAGHYAPSVVPYLKHWMPSSISYFLAFLIILILTIIAACLIGILISILLKSSMLGWLDHLLGAFLGAAKAILIASIILVLINTFYFIPNKWKKDSLTYPYLSDVAKWMTAEEKIGKWVKQKG
jgi:membrane protein required for colicin V production